MDDDRQDVETLIRPAWIIPVEPHGSVLADHALAVAGGRIVGLCPAEEAEPRFRAREIVDLPGHALLPGLVNAHTHAAMNLFRGLADDRPLMEWLTEHIWPAEQRWVSAEFVRDGARHAVAEMLRGGTTCFCDMYFFPDQTAYAAAELGMRAVVGLVVIDFPSAWAGSLQEYFARGEAVHDEFRDHPLIRTCFAPHAPYSVPDSALEHIATLAEELDIPIAMHVHEAASEIEQAAGERPLSRLHRLGLLSPRLLAVHVTQIEPAEIERLAHLGVNVVHCPESNLKLASGLCPVDRLQRAGVTVALGTDGAASNNDLDMLGEMRTAALLGKAVAADCTALGAPVALRMATLDSARALALDAEIGSLVPGKLADVIAVDLGRLENQPVYDPLSQLVYAASRHDVTGAWVGGRQVMRDGHLLDADEQAIVRRSATWQARIAAGRAS